MIEHTEILSLAESDKYFAYRCLMVFKDPDLKIISKSVWSAVDAADKEFFARRGVDLVKDHQSGLKREQMDMTWTNKQLVDLINEDDYFAYRCAIFLDGRNHYGASVKRIQSGLVFPCSKEEWNNFNQKTKNDFSKQGKLALADNPKWFLELCNKGK